MKGNKKYLEICLYVFGTAAAILIFWRLLSGSQNLWSTVSKSISMFMKVLTPFFIAVACAYIFSPAATAVERFISHIWRNPGKRKQKQLLSITIVYVLLLLSLASMIYFTIPDLVRNVVELANNIPTYMKSAENFYYDVVFNHPVYNNEWVQNILSNIITTVQTQITDWSYTALNTVAQGAYSVVTFLVNVFIGLILSIYFMTARGNIMYGLKRLLIAKWGTRKTDNVVRFLMSVDRVFGQYIGSKILESVIVYLLTQIAFSIMGIKYSALMSLIIAITNLIPYIGPFIGALPPVLITIFEDPLKALYVVIAVTIIQMLDAYVISPKLIGDKMGLNPFWVMFVVIVGGGFFGLMGMVLSVPVAAVIQLILNDYIIMRAKGKRKTDED